MLPGRQRQKAGSDSTQIQAENVIVVQGVTEERAAEIAEYKAQQAILEFADDAKKIAESRISRFDQQVIAELAAKGLLATFSDPGFQILLNKAQIQAAASDEPADHDLLTRLLIERAADKRKPVHLAVSRATEAIDSLSEDALIGLTLLWFTVKTTTTLSDPATTLVYRDRAYEQLLAMGPLPEGRRWLQDLDLLDLIRVSFGGSRSLKTFEDITFDSRPALFSRGLSEEEAQEARKQLAAISDRLPGLIVPHSLLPGCFRFALSHENDREIIAKTVELDTDKASELERIFDIYSVNTVDPATREKAIERMDQLPHYSIVRKWHNSFSAEVAVDFASPGIAVGYSNAGRFLDLSGLGTLPEVIERST